MDSSDLLKILEQLVHANGAASGNSSSSGPVESLVAKPSSNQAAQGPKAPIPPIRTAVTLVTQSEEEQQSTERLIRQLADLTVVAREQAESTETNTKAVIENSLSSRSSGGGSKAGSVGKSVLSFLSGGFGVLQLVGKLFEGNHEEAVASSPSYMMPAPINLEAGISSLVPQTQAIRYGQDGLPTAAPAATIPPTTNVTVQVQAMDSRSFLDHSGEIAQAVKDALLHSHSLNDVVSEV